MIIATTGGSSLRWFYTPPVSFVFMIETEPNSVSKAESEGFSLDTLESHLWGAADILRASHRAVSVNIGRKP
jgi:hypothetical protein